MFNNQLLMFLLRRVWYQKVLDLKCYRSATITVNMIVQMKISSYLTPTRKRLNTTDNQKVSDSQVQV